MDRCNEKRVLDLSSFFLVEFSDDSEADHDSNIASVSVKVDEEGNDDAQSCCNDFSGSGSGQEGDETDIERPWEEEEDDEDEEEGVVNMSVKRRGSDSKTCIQGRGRYHHQQPVNEVERNKMFWETCLASGY